MSDLAVDATHFVNALLSLFPSGVNAPLLLDVLKERGINQDEAASAVRRGLDRGTLELGDRLQIVLVWRVMEGVG